MEFLIKWRDKPCPENLDYYCFSCEKRRTEVQKVIDKFRELNPCS